MDVMGLSEWSRVAGVGAEPTDAQVSPIRGSASLPDGRLAGEHDDQGGFTCDPGAACWRRSSVAQVSPIRGSASLPDGGLDAACNTGGGGAEALLHAPSIAECATVLSRNGAVGPGCDDCCGMAATKRPINCHVSSAG